MSHRSPSGARLGCGVEPLMEESVIPEALARSFLSHAAAGRCRVAGGVSCDLFGSAGGS